MPHNRPAGSIGPISGQQRCQAVYKISQQKIIRKNPEEAAVNREGNRKREFARRSREDQRCQY